MFIILLHKRVQIKNNIELLTVVFFFLALLYVYNKYLFIVCFVCSLIVLDVFIIYNILYW